MANHFVAVGEVGINLQMVVSWEWNPSNAFLVIHLLNNIIYLRGQPGQAMWLLLDTLATVRMGEQQRGSGG